MVNWEVYRHIWEICFTPLQSTCQQIYCEMWGSRNFQFEGVGGVRFSCLSLTLRREFRALICQKLSQKSFFNEKKSLKVDLWHFMYLYQRECYVSKKYLVLIHCKFTSISFFIENILWCHISVDTWFLKSPRSINVYKLFSSKWLFSQSTFFRQAYLCYVWNTSPNILYFVFVFILFFLYNNVLNSPWLKQFLSALKSAPWR